MARQARFVQVHDVLSASWSRSDQDHPTKDRWSIQRYVLRDHAIQRESEDITVSQMQSINEGKGVVCHARHGHRHRTGGPPDARIVEEDHLSTGG